MMWSSAHELAGILGVSEDPIVSCDVIGSPFSCLFDPSLTTVAGRLIRISGWYDNEMGYSARLIDLFQQA
jgi:glyceraldehyde 3-phosphate dehydrogenase